MFGYKDSTEYYRAATISGHLHKITCPTLYLGSLDDPLHTPESFPEAECEKTPNILLATTNYGGHVCHLTHRQGPGLLGKLSWIFPASEWFAEPIAEFFDCLEKNNIKEHKRE